MSELHEVKQETFNTSDHINVDPKGFVRAVDSYHSTNFGLYMARGADHPEFGYLESWLLPELGLRANIFHYRPEVGKDFDFYIDIVDIKKDGDVWTTRDLYVDLQSTTGQPVEVLDTGELSAATSAGLISAVDAEYAIDRTLAAVEGITRHGDDAMAWLSANGIELTWADRNSIALTPCQG